MASTVGACSAFISPFVRIVVRFLGPGSTSWSVVVSLPGCTRAGGAVSDCINAGAAVIPLLAQLVFHEFELTSLLHCIF